MSDFLTAALYKFVDLPDFAEFLVKEGIESMSLNPDSVVKTLEQVAELEEKLSR